MQEHLERLLAAYEKGRLDRRQLLAALLLLTTARSRATSAQEPEPTFRGSVVNHVTLAVGDVGRSRAFYEKLLGARTLEEVGSGVDLGIGKSFVGLYPMGPPPRIHHFSIGVEDFDADAGREALQRDFPESEPVVRTNELGQKELYLDDPDGIRVQISAPDYKLAQ